jgi:predicted  nucleic acid-binding Zn-ribbon protein
MILEQAEQKQITDLMDNYRRLHTEIKRVEESIEEFQKTLNSLNEVKDVVVKGIEENRENESTIIKSLVEKYGEGKLDLTNFEWVTNNK